MAMISSATDNSERNDELFASKIDENGDSEQNNDTQQQDTDDDIKGWGFSDPRLRPFVVISITYLLFTVTDGAIRMIGKILFCSYSVLETKSVLSKFT